MASAVQTLLQQAYILATGTSASATKLAAYEAVVLQDGNYGRIARIVETEMGSLAGQIGTLNVFRMLARNGLNVTYASDAEAQLAMDGLAAQGVSGWSALFAHWVLLNSGQALALDNKA